jgi:hypothetical protein
MTDTNPVLAAILQSITIAEANHETLGTQLEILEIKIDRLTARIEGRAPVAPEPIAAPPE